ncbi:MAG: anaerobic ribonucleoside-triphosphate reductase activating protein [Deltaproteobacteria bacterium]|nr:MAG: anaerobic ribonucleoside-triphosphate reductase activating protein [Deltaproteobacteria bacterium]
MIKGFQGTSLLDFPGRVASLLFWGGCNLTCPFCHNPALVIAPGDFPDLDRDALLQDLAGRRPFIDGVVLSGGEPTLDPSLPDWLTAVKALGLAVKLDTNGLRPDVIARLIEDRLVDSLAIDLKTAPWRYGELHRAPVDPAPLTDSIRLALAAPVSVEFRTTCVPGIVGEADIRALGELIRGAARWTLQQYHPAPALDPAWRELVPCTADQLAGLAAIAREYVPEVVLRGG